MAQEEKLFTPDHRKMRYKIIIEAYDNCASFAVEVPKGMPPATYHDVMGVLEAQKFHVMESQRLKNIEAGENFKKKKK